jgi:hypothetical protein
MNKYRNIPVIIDGFRFPSKKEGFRYLVLKKLEKQGEIKNLKRQVSYKLEINGVKICSYRADFVYFDVSKNKEIVEDTKGFKTDTYKFKKKLMLALHNIDIYES